MAYFIRLTRNAKPVFINIDTVVDITPADTGARLEIAGGSKTEGLVVILVDESLEDVLARIPDGMKQL